MNTTNSRNLSSDLSHRVDEVDEVAGDECEGARVDGVEVVPQGAVVAEGVAGKDGTNIIVFQPPWFAMFASPF